MTTTTRDTVTSPATDADSALREGYAEISDVECITLRPATGRWSSCCTASRSSGTAGGSRSHRS